MTDEQIIKALECCIESSSPEACNKCPLKRDNGNISECLEQKEKLSLDLINYQKAEIDELRERISYLEKSIDCSRKEYNQLFQKLQHAKSEAIYKLVMRFKDRVVSKYEYVQVDIFNELDNLVKEMTEVQE